MPKFFAELGLLFLAFASPLLLWNLFDGNLDGQENLELSSETLASSETQASTASVDLQEALYPEAPLTRLELLLVLDEQKREMPTSAPSEDSLALASLALESLSDVQSIPQHHKLIEKALTEGWIKVPSNGLFRPYELTTRAEALSMILAFFKKDTLSTVIPNFKDVAPYEDWFASMSAFALREGWSSAENFEPHRPITRAELFTWLELATN